MKYKLLAIFVLVIGVFSTTFCAFTTGTTQTGSIQTNELSAVFLGNAEFLAKVQALDSSIVSVDKNVDLVRVTTVPTVSLTSSNIVSTSESSVPAYLWVESGTIYYYTAATYIDLNNA